MKKEEQGASFNRYKVIPRSLIFVTRKNEILLLKGDKKKKLWAGKYNGIGGHIEKGENVYQSAVRELYEETGLKDVHLVFRGSIMIDVDDDTGISLFLFIGEYQAGDIKPSEEGFLEWVPIERIAEYPLVEDLHVLIPRLLKQKETFLFGNYCFEGDKLVMAFLD
jgi:8-oxo-dGTP diphosphatase